MRRKMFGSVVVLSLVAVGILGADDAKDKDGKEKKLNKATITKVDAKKGSVVVTTKDEDGKDIQKTYQLADGAEYIGGNGKAAKIEAFQTGDRVRITEKDGKITELKKCSDRNHATISKVDASNNTVAVTMKDADGKEVEKTIKLASDAQYFDNNGKPAKVDAFKMGDHVLLTEKDGKITEMKKGVEHAQAKITKVDSDKGTVSAIVKDRNGKEAEKIFYLTDDIEYIDSTGEIATIDVFDSGDEVLIFETEGKIKELNKDSTPKETAEKKVSAK